MFSLCILFVSAVLLQDNGSAKYFQGTRTGINMGEKVAQVNISFFPLKALDYIEMKETKSLLYDNSYILLLNLIICFVWRTENEILKLIPQFHDGSWNKMKFVSFKLLELSSWILWLSIESANP